MYTAIFQLVILKKSKNLSMLKFNYVEPILKQPGHILRLIQFPYSKGNFLYKFINI